jgi:hypothetical protein
VWADAPGDHPDGICMDADGAVWYADVGNKQGVRVREGGEVLATVDLDRGAFACVNHKVRLLLAAPVVPGGFKSDASRALHGRRG